MDRIENLTRLAEAVQVWSGCDTDEAAQRAGHILGIAEENICPPCLRGQHEHCYNIQLGDAGPAGQVCECRHPGA